jgi:hypothetical protein
MEGEFAGRSEARWSGFPPIFSERGESLLTLHAAISN